MLHSILASAREVSLQNDPDMPTVPIISNSTSKICQSPDTSTSRKRSREPQRQHTPPTRLVLFVNLSILEVQVEYPVK
ncbi:hypothetical protein CEXT_698831 [Caerostris extrusa]|uniref:Uncharacterized protein n=1 Tax=Caerostris extrusa TaxID=172846 RepID=A0AAV4WYD8_CAEEX|nr:hypothetical protein CEXT_698831 [Caerostris extrusa]